RARPEPVDAPELAQAEMDASVEEAHRWGRKAAAHCHGDTAARMAVKAGVDSIEHGTFLKPDTLLAMKKRGVFLVPGPIADPAGLQPGFAKKFPPSILEKARAATKAWPDMIRNSQKIGVRIGFVSDSAVSPDGQTNPTQNFWR